MNGEEILFMSYSFFFFFFNVYLYSGNPLEINIQVFQVSYLYCIYLTFLFTYNTQFKCDTLLTTIKAKFFRFSHDVVTCDVDRDVSTAYC